MRADFREVPHTFKRRVEIYLHKIKHAICTLPPKTWTEQYFINPGEEGYDKAMLGCWEETINVNFDNE